MAPLTFEIYDQGRRLTSYAVRAGGIVGPESVPAGGRVAFEGGLLVAEAGEVLDDEPQAAVGITLLWDAGEAGAYVLETCRLPPRRQPYVLNVELARHRLMRLVHKQEDWTLWDAAAVPPAAEPLERLRRAQQTFAEALGLLHDAPAAAQKADEALALAIHVGEELAAVQAESILAARRKNGPPLKTLFGVRADPAVQNAKYRGTLARFFDYAIVPVSWGKLQPEEDLFDTAACDSTIEFLHRNRLPTIAGPLIDLSEGQVPEWLFIYEHDFEALRDLAFEFVKSVVTRYRRVVKLWNVVAGLHAPGGFGLSFEQMIELTRLTVTQVKAVNPAAKTLVTVRTPFGEYLSDPLAPSGGGGGGVPPLLYAEMVAQSGLECDGIGVEIQTGVPRRGMFCRDLFQISAMLDRFATLNKPVFVTAVACPDRSRVAGKGDPAEGGRWHGDWTPERQAKWLRAVYRVAMSKPYVENVAWADLSDLEAGQTSLPGSGLLDDMLRPKPAFEAIQEFRRTLRPPPKPAAVAPPAPKPA